MSLVATVQRAVMDAFEASKHPRSHGQFASVSGGGAAAVPTKKWDTKRAYAEGHRYAGSLPPHPENRETYRAKMAEVRSTHGHKAAEYFHEGAKRAYRLDSGTAMKEAEQKIRESIEKHAPAVREHLRSLGINSVSTLGGAAGKPTSLALRGR